MSIHSRTKEYLADTPFPFGRYEGTIMDNVPAGYLLTIRDTDWIIDWPGIKKYIDEHEAELEQELRETLERKLNPTG